MLPQLLVVTLSICSQFLINLSNCTLHALFVARSTFTLQLLLLPSSSDFVKFLPHFHNHIDTNIKTLFMVVLVH